MAFRQLVILLTGAEANPTQWNRSGTTGEGVSKCQGGSGPCLRLEGKCPGKGRIPNSLPTGTKRRGHWGVINSVPPPKYHAIAGQRRISEPHARGHLMGATVDIVAVVYPGVAAFYDREIAP